MVKERNKKACPEPHQRVLVALSGGVDSSVAAALLRKQGFNVIGVFMRLNDFSKESENKARKVAKILNIPFRILDLRKEFKEEVINYFIEGYKKGVTPNPCVVCNKKIKFAFLLKEASRLRVDFIVTGHYAKKTYNSQLKTYNLLKGKDKNKDQSYFLWKLAQKELKNILLPLGDYTKVEVKKLAKKLKLPVFSAPESQEVCFIKDNINVFLKRYIKLKEGDIIEQPAFAFSKLRRGGGKFLGKHKGLPLYTIGQRKGISLSGGPHYVSGFDPKKNNLIVTKNQKDLSRKELVVKDVNWISDKTPKLPMKAMVKIRYRSKSELAIIYKALNTKYKILFAKPQRAITPGQSAVFYRGEELLGGGIIC